MALQSICRFFFIYACFVLAQGAPFCSLKQVLSVTARGEVFLSDPRDKHLQGKKHTFTCIISEPVQFDLPEDNDDDILYLA